MSESLLWAVASAIGVGFLAAMSPGPDGLLILRTALRHGRCAGLASLAGVALGNLAFAIAARWLLGAAGHDAIGVLRPLQIAGAIYLAWLGVRMLRSSGEIAAAPEREGAGRWIVTGLLTNLSNPKVLLFYLALLPQLAAGSEHVDAVVAGVLAGSLLFFGLIAVFAPLVRTRMTPTSVRRVDQLSGALFLALAAWGLLSGLD